MITFSQSTDPHSLDVMRGGVVVGAVQWHPGGPPRLVAWGPLGAFSLSELQDIVEKLTEVSRR